jgi:hypothetical protein
VTRDDAPVVPHSRASAAASGKRPLDAVDDLFAADGEWALGPLNAVSVDELEQADEEDLLELAGF